MNEYCDACAIHVKPEWDHTSMKDTFNMTSSGEGPYCDKCWYWQEQIEYLKELLNESTNG